MDIDIIVLSECWGDAHSVPPIIDDYRGTMYSTKCSFNKNNGVIMYIKAEIAATVTKVDLQEANCLAAKIGNITFLGIKAKMF